MNGTVDGNKMETDNRNPTYQILIIFFCLMSQSIRIIWSYTYYTSFSPVSISYLSLFPFITFLYTWWS